jgi:hypothetical protein
MYALFFPICIATCHAHLILLDFDNSIYVCRKVEVPEFLNTDISPVHYNGTLLLFSILFSPKIRGDVQFDPSQLVPVRQTPQVTSHLRVALIL